MTLLEIMFVVAIMTVVLGMIATLGLTISDTSTAQMAKSTAVDEARRAMITLTGQLRNAAKSSLTSLPGNTITFRVARDVDGNGSAVDHGGNLELSNAITVKPDTADENHDTRKSSQLIMKDGATTVVLANNLASVNGVFFERAGAAVRVTVRTQGLTRRKNIVTYTLTETVFPRN